MKSIILVIIFSIFSILSVQALPDCYHTYAEVVAELQQLEIDYHDFAKLYIIGYSQQDNIPIYALKISDNPDQEEAEPAVLFIGQVHAEEVMGVEITMRNINEILLNNFELQYGVWIGQLEMWFIPTLNPEGHNVVSADIDESYRKNKHDINNNGIFDFNPNVGFDDDGVDINRNFGCNWVHGDTLFAPPTPSSSEAYDYYRGEAPMSERETQAFKAFCDVQKPVYCIVWHSSRSLNSGLNEKVFYPLNWAGVRPAPELDRGQQIGEGVAQQIIKENGSTYYEPSAALGRKGGINDWMYQQYGTLCLVIECCKAPNIQPTDSLMNDTIDRCSNGVRWLLERALDSSELDLNSMLTGTIKDAVTNLPLQAEIIVEQKQAPWFAPRKSDPILGRYWRPIMYGTYDLRFRKKGYFDFITLGKVVNPSSRTPANANLIPRPAATISGTVFNSNTHSLIPAKILLYDVENDTLITNGEFILHTYEGNHRIEICSEGYFPYIDTLEIASGVQNLNLNIALSPINAIFTENWENSTSNWSFDDPTKPWVIQNVLAVNGHAITDSWGGKGFYAMNCNTWMKTNNAILLPDSGQTMLTFDEHLYTEFVYDSVRVEVSTDNTVWHTVYSNAGQYDWWHPVYVPLTQYAGQSLFFRFRLTDHSTDEDLTDPGWTIDNIQIISGTATHTTEGPIITPPVTALYPNFPNPFNPETNIKFSTSRDGEVNIDIYNLKGQKVRQLTKEIFKSGTHSLKWNGLDDKGKAVSSGIYFCKMHSADKAKTLKMVLMK